MFGRWPWPTSWIVRRRTELGIDQFPKRGHPKTPPQKSAASPGPGFFDGVHASKKLTTTVSACIQCTRPELLFMRDAGKRVGQFFRSSFALFNRWYSSCRLRMSRRSLRPAAPVRRDPSLRVIPCRVSWMQELSAEQLVLPVVQRHPVDVQLSRHRLCTPFPCGQFVHRDLLGRQ